MIDFSAVGSGLAFVVLLFKGLMGEWFVAGGTAIVTTLVSMATAYAFKYIISGAANNSHTLQLANVIRHSKSTLIGLFLAAVLIALVYPLRVATMAEITPFLLIIIPFLIYGKKRSEGPDVGV